MGTTRRKFTLEFKTDAAHRVIDTGRTVVEVAGEFSVDKGSLARWVRDERRRLEAVAGSSDGPLSPAERAELLRLRRLWGVTWARVLRSAKVALEGQRSLCWLRAWFLQ